jgi:hypothetical protein
MKTTCQNLTIVVLFVLSMIAFAAQLRSRTAKGPLFHGPSQIALPNAANKGSPKQSHNGMQKPDTPANELFMPITFATFSNDSRIQEGNLIYSGSPLPLLSCIGVGMAIGGIVSVRFAQREDK